MNNLPDDRTGWNRKCNFAKLLQAFLNIIAWQFPQIEPMILHKKIIYMFKKKLKRGLKECEVFIMTTTY